MPTPLLSTKLFIPPTRPELVPRPRLIQRLEEGLERKLILVSASAGFGKTTLLSNWASVTSVPVAWLSLEEQDNNPTRFWTYFVAALQTVCADAEARGLEALSSHPVPPIEQVLTSLINQAAESLHPFVLVADDLHTVTDPRIHQDLAFLVKNLPPQMSLAVSSRADPPWPLGGLRAHGQMVELRTDDLRFTQEETVAFLNQAMQLELGNRDLVTLRQRTEGWIAGLQMVALSLQGRTEPSTFIQSLAGSHRFILDYLVEEVIEKQPQQIQEFLLKTSILDRLTAPLCEAVLEVGGWRLEVGEESLTSNLQPPTSSFQSPTSSIQSLLEHLESSNLFLVPLDEERIWYRYHHLFAALLRKRLGQTRAEIKPSLHLRASEWYEANGLIAEAASHALAGGHTDRISRLVEQNALGMLDHGELASLLGWLSGIPDTVLQDRPWLGIAYGWALAYSGHLESAQVQLQGVEQSLGELEEGSQEARHLGGHIAAIRAFTAILEGDDYHGAELARRALELLPERDLTTRGFVATQLGTALRSIHGLPRATEATSEASFISRAAGDSHVAVMTLCDLAGLQRLQGHLQKAATTYREALQLAQEYEKRSGRELPIVGYVYGRMSTVLTEMSDGDAAVQLARKGVELCRGWGFSETLVDCLVYLAIALEAAGDSQEARDTIWEAKQAAERISPWYSTVVDLFEARIHLSQGNIASASNWAAKQIDKFSSDERPDTRHAAMYLTMIQILATQALLSESEGQTASVSLATELEKALDSFGALLDSARSEGQMMRVIEILITQAITCEALGRPEQAQAALGQALHLAEPEGYVQIFVSKGSPLAFLLQRGLDQGTESEFARMVLSAFQGASSADDQPGASALLEPLSGRELQVLRLVAAGLSNREIAAELFLAVGTVKKYTSNIYGKLGVNRRTQAVSRAREMELL